MGNLILKFANFFLHLWGTNLYGGSKNYMREQYLLLRFHYFISLEAAYTQKREVLILRMSSGNVNTSGFTC